MRVGLVIVCASVIGLFACSDGRKEKSAEAVAAPVPCDASGAQQRADWVTKPSTNWSGDPGVPESQHDHGLRIAGACNTALKYRAFACDPTSHSKNVHGFNFFIAQRLGFQTVICDEIDGIDTSKRLVEYPISTSYKQGEFTTYLKESVAEYSEAICKCKSKPCATTVRTAYDELAELVPLLPLDSPSRDDEGKIDASRTRYLKCEKRMLGTVVRAKIEAAAAPSLGSLSRDPAMAKMNQFANQMCTCNDKACADKVQESMTMWSTEMVAKGGERSVEKPSEADMKLMTAVGQKYANCMTDAMMSPADRAGSRRVPSHRATGGGALPAECGDYKAAIEVFAKCDKIPKAERDALKQSYRQSVAAWRTLSPEEKAVLPIVCEAATAAVTDMSSVCDPPGPPPGSTPPQKIDGAGVIDPGFE